MLSCYLKKQNCFDPYFNEYFKSFIVLGRYKNIDFLGFRCINFKGY